MKLLNVVSLNDARRIVSECFDRLDRKVEEIEIDKAAGRVLAEDVVSAENVPGFNKSTVDGYAVRASDTHGASDSIPAFLELVGEVSIGRKSGLKISPGQCAYVPTGAPVPEGADAMVMVEYCESFDSDHIAVYSPVAAGNSMIMEGDDARVGDRVLSAGKKLRFQEVGLLASLGIGKVKVKRKLRVSIISTGDELKALGQGLEPGEIYDSNSHALKVQSQAIGLDVISTSMVRDDGESLKASISDAMKESDIVITSGGSSQGRKDYTESMFDLLSGGNILLHGLALKPGKPTLAAYDEASSTLLLGLPGHPVAASTVHMLLLAYCTEKYYNGHDAEQYEKNVQAVIKRNIPGAPGRETCIPVVLTETDAGFEAEPAKGNSALWTLFTQADGYLIIDRNCEGLKAGEMVSVTLFSN